MHVAHDATHLFFHVRTRDALTASTDADWMVLLLDTDQDARTGHLGYDYRLNHTRGSPDSSRAGRPFQLPLQLSRHSRVRRTRVVELRKKAVRDEFKSR